jgi:ATP-dependent helicase/nuclease subunit B
LFRLQTDVTEHLREGGTLVVPSRQRAHAVRLAQAAGELAAGRQVWASADVLGASSWLRREAERGALQAGSSPRLLSAAEEWLLWRQCAFDATRSLALVDGGALAESLQRASELAADFHITLKVAPPDTEAGLLFQTQRAFRARCQALGAASVSVLLEQLARAADSTRGALLLRGFDALSARLRSLVPAHALRAGAAAGAAPALLRASDAQEELGRITEWCQARVRQQRDTRLLVMLPGAPGPRERLAAMIRQALDPRAAALGAPAAAALVGIEGGQALAQLPMIAHALTSLSWLAGQELEFERLCAWLRSPQWARPSAPARARLALQLREHRFLAVGVQGFLGALQIVPAPLQPPAREISAQLARAAAALGEARASPRLWSERFSAALAGTGWPGALGADSSGQQTLLRWHELLEEFGALSASAGSVARAEALRLLTELAARTAFRPADEDVTVTISPMLADPVVSYDGIWVGGLNAEAFPQAVQPDPFLPLEAQLAAQVPAASAAGRLAQARSLLSAWRAGTAELVLSAPAHAQDLELLPSPLLGDFAAPGALAPLTWLAARVRREAQTETLSDARGERWSVRQRLPRGTRSLDLQNLCPFRAYAELRLGATPPEIAEPGIPATVRGVLLHAALQKLWERLHDSRALQELSDPALEELIGESVAQAAQATLLQAPGRGRRRRRVAAGQLDMFSAIPAPVARECRRAARLIRRLCELERTRQPFKVEQAESHAQLTLGGATLHMRVDRVDRLVSGGRAILDYKSGLRTAADWYGERPTHPQLLAYAQALGEDVVALATVSVNARKVRFAGIARDPKLLPQVKAVQTTAGRAGAEAWRERQLAWRAILERLIASFLAGEAAVDPVPGACSYCQVIDICRIGERASDTEPAGSLAEGNDE